MRSCILCLFCVLSPSLALVVGCGSSPDGGTPPDGSRPTAGSSWCGIPGGAACLCGHRRRAMYGLGYAAAQDRPFQMYYNLRIIQGRLAEVVGDVKVGVTRQQPQGRNSALRSDVQMRTIGYWRAAQETAERLDPRPASSWRPTAGASTIAPDRSEYPVGLFEKSGLEPEPWTPAAVSPPGGG